MNKLTLMRNFFYPFVCWHTQILKPKEIIRSSQSFSSTIFLPTASSTRFIREEKHESGDENFSCRPKFFWIVDPIQFNFLSFHVSVVPANSNQRFCRTNSNRLPPGGIAYLCKHRDTPIACKRCLLDCWMDHDMGNQPKTDLFTVTIVKLPKSPDATFIRLWSSHRQPSPWH